MWEWLKDIFNAIGDIASTIGSILSDGFSVLWSWLSDIFDTIGNIASLVISGITDFFSDVVSALITLVTEYLNPFSDNFILLKLWNFFTTLISYINPFDENFFGYTLIDLIKSALQYLFVPSDNYFSDNIDYYSDALNDKIPFYGYLESLENTGDVSSSSDLTVDFSNYSLMGKINVSLSKFINFSIFSNYKDTWYAWIRVIVYIALIIYNINEVIKFLRGFNVTNGSGVSSSQNSNEKGD